MHIHTGYSMGINVRYDICLLRAVRCIEPANHFAKRLWSSSWNYFIQAIGIPPSTYRMFSFMLKWPRNTGSFCILTSKWQPSIWTGYLMEIVDGDGDQVYLWLWTPDLLSLKAVNVLGLGDKRADLMCESYPMPEEWWLGWRWILSMLPNSTPVVLYGSLW